MPSSTPYFSMAASVSPPPASEKAWLAAMAWAIARVPSPNWSNSNTPTGPFHSIVPASAMSCAKRSAVSGPMSRINSPGCTSWMPRTSACGGGRELVATTTSVGNGMSAPRSLARAISLRHVSSMSASRATCRLATPLAARKVLAMPPPTISRSTLSSRASRMVSLVLNLRAGHDRHQRPRGLLQRALQRVELALQQRTGTGLRREARHAVGRRLRAVRRAEGIHHEHIAQRRHLLAQILVVLLLALVEAHVLAQHGVPGLDLHAVRDSPLPAAPSGPAVPRGAAPPGPATVPGSDLPSSGRPRWDIRITRGALRQRQLDGRQRGADARVAA